MPMVRCKPAVGRFPTPRVPRANMGDLNILSRPGCWSAIERAGEYAGSRYILKPDELSIPGQFARSKSAEVRVASGDLKRPQVFWSTDRADRRDRSSLKGVKGERLAQWYDAVRHILLGIIWRKTAADPAAPLLRSLPASCWNERSPR